MARATVESYRQGADAGTRDGLLFSRPWGFEAEAIPFEKLFLWQGEQYRVMPAAAARLLAEALSHCASTFCPDEGHLSTLVQHVQEIWAALSA